MSAVHTFGYGEPEHVSTTHSAYRWTVTQHNTCLPNRIQVMDSHTALNKAMMPLLFGRNYTTNLHSVFSGWLLFSTSPTISHKSSDPISEENQDNKYNTWQMLVSS